MTTNEAMTKLNEYLENIHLLLNGATLKLLKFERKKQQLLSLVEPGKCAK